jgi:glycosyltransferase involved in cell wall biosynthesis
MFSKSGARKIFNTLKEKVKLIRMTTVPISMNIILKGQLSFINQFYEVIGVTGDDSKHFGQIRMREGIRMHPINMERNISLIKDMLSIIKLYYFFINERPAIVHTQTPKAGLLGMVAAWFAGVPVRLHTVGGMPLMGTKGFKRWLLKVMERLTYACAHRVYPNSTGLMNIIVNEKLCHQNKLKVLANGGSNGVDTEYFDPAVFENQELSKAIVREKYGFTEKDFIFLFVGRMAIEKGFSELVAAFEEIQKVEFNRVPKLLLIGTFERHYGVLGNQLKERIESNSDIVTLGRFDDVRPFYWLSDIYVFPSYREGFPNTLLEAGAMGLPIIATDINGCNEIVADGINGLLIAPKSSDELFQAMKKSIDLKLSFNTVQKNRMIIEQKFKSAILWEELLEQYGKFCLEKSL